MCNWMVISIYTKTENIKPKNKTKGNNCYICILKSATIQGMGLISHYFQQKQQHEFEGLQYHV